MHAGVERAPWIQLCLHRVRSDIGCREELALTDHVLLSSQSAKGCESVGGFVSVAVALSARPSET